MELATTAHVYRISLLGVVGVLFLGLTASALPRHRGGLRTAGAAGQSARVISGLFAVVEGRSRRAANSLATSTQPQQTQRIRKARCRLRHMHRFGEVVITRPGCQPKQHVIPVCQGGCLSWAKPVYQSASFQMRRKCCIPTDFKPVEVVLDCGRTQTGKLKHESVTVHHPTGCACR